MSNTRSLDRALAEVLSEIRSRLADKIKLTIEKSINEIRKADGLHKLIKQKDDLQERQREARIKFDKLWDQLGHEINIVEREIDNKDGFTTKCESLLTEDEAKLIDVVNNGYHKTKSQIKAMKKNLNTADARNYLNFLKLETNTRTMYDLAITSKEKRNIIFSIQSRDWRSLGIDIPQLPHFEKFEITEGELKLPTKALLQSKN